MMEVLYLYWAFSTLFMFGSAVEDSTSSTRQSGFVYFNGILLAPLVLPFVLGMLLTKGGGND